MKHSDLKCCGNCAFFDSDASGGAPYNENKCTHAHSNSSMEPYEYCDRWSYDEITREGRLGK